MFKTLLASLLFIVLLVSNLYSVDNSLILYLPLDDGAGDVVSDKSNNANNGQKFGNAKWVDGKIGKCLEFTSGSYVKVPEIPDYDVTDAISLMAWVKTTSVSTWARVIDRSQWQDNGFDLALSQVTHAPLFEFFVNNTTSQALAVTKVDDGKWHFIVGTFGNKKVRIYVDGVMEAEVTSVGEVNIKPNDWPITLGVEANNLSGQPYTGQIDEVAIYNRELSANAINDIYKNGIPTSSLISSIEKLTTTWSKIKR